MIDLMTESYESLLAESLYYSEAFSIGYFSDSIQIAQEYWIEMNGLAEYGSVGEYLCHHLKKYYKPLTDSIPIAIESRLEEFNCMKLRDRPFLKVELEPPFKVYSEAIQDLYAQYGCPRHVRRRPRPGDITMNVL